MVGRRSHRLIYGHVRGRERGCEAVLEREVAEVNIREGTVLALGRLIKLHEGYDLRELSGYGAAEVLFDGWSACVVGIRLEV